MMTDMKILSSLSQVPSANTDVDVIQVLKKWRPIKMMKVVLSIIDVQVTDQTGRSPSQALKRVKMMTLQMHQSFF